MALALGAVLALIVRLRGDGGGDALRNPVAPGTPDAAGDAPERRGGLPDPDELFRQERYGEAIHALLLRALLELGRRSRELAPSSTSREIVRRLAPETALFSALLPLVSAVERMHFGRQPAGRAEYTDCAAHYRRFTEAWRATAR